MLKQDILALGRYLREIYSLGGNQVHYHVKSVQALKEASEGMIPQFEKALTQCVYAAQTDSSKSLGIELEALLGKVLSRVLRTFQEVPSEGLNVDWRESESSSVYCRSILGLLETVEASRRKLAAAVIDRERAEIDLTRKDVEIEKLKEQVVLFRDIVEQCKRLQSDSRPFVPQGFASSPHEYQHLKKRVVVLESILEERASLIASLRQDVIHRKEEIDAEWYERCQTLKEWMEALQREKEDLTQQNHSLRVQLDRVRDECNEEMVRGKGIMTNQHEKTWNERENEFVLLREKNEDEWKKKLRVQKQALDKCVTHHEVLERHIVVLKEEKERLVKMRNTEDLQEENRRLERERDELFAERNRYKTHSTDSERVITALHASIAGKDIQFHTQASKLASTEQQLTNATQQRMYQADLLQELEDKLHRSIPNDEAHVQLQIENEKKWNQRLSAVEHLLALEKQNAAILRDQQQVTLSIERDKVAHATKQMRVMANELETANLCLAERKKQREILEAQLVGLRLRDGQTFAELV
uniref:AlNc14C94G5785 protein n=1 Tax=Albugo laibachii Nc14 TaxID=890382 RepID=F0WGQ8_9STRA|nr:AlNc14C94G5785 [Albugo laibachii Nc14]|eukprot:CCA20422.1 AlNc14C94G5785 [Albugo laibachii Nc14]